MRIASIAFVKHVVKHTVYKRSRQGSAPDPHRNQKSGSPCPITPPELETLSHAGPRGDHPGARGRGAPLSQRIARFLYRTPHAGPRCTFLGLHRVGDTVVTKSFLCVAFCALRVARTMLTNPFFYLHFSAFPARQRAFPGWACPFSPVREEGPSPGLHRPLRACVRELSRTSRGLACRLGRR